MDDKYVTTLRLYKNNPAHFQALTCLEAYNRELFASQNDFIAEAVIHYSEYLKQKQKMRSWNVPYQIYERRRITFVN